MDRNAVARILEEIAAMLELAGENAFKVRAYEAGARAILSFSGDLEEAVRSRELLTVPAIGSGLFANIETLAQTGTLPYYDELRARFPPGLRECLRIPGLGASKVRQLHEALGIDSLDALEKACREGRLSGVKGFGPSSVERIVQGIALLRSSAGFHRYPKALRRGEEILAGAPDIRPRLADRDRREPPPAQGDHPRHRHRRRLREPAALSALFRTLPGAVE